MKIIESNNQIKLKIYTELAKEFNAKFNRNREKIQAEIRELASVALITSETFRSLVYGELNSHFGFNEGTASFSVNSIIALIVSKINMTYVQAKATVNGLNSGLYINLYRGTHSILESNEAYIQAENYNIPWLKWLLTEGDKIIVSGYNIKFEDGKGRSGWAIMIQDNSKSWRVPAEYSGVEDDNWITRSLQTSQFKEGLESILSKYL